MKMVALKCPNCAGEIQLDSSKDIGYCMYCGSKVMVQETLNQTVKIDESSKIENWIALAFDALKLNRPAEAEDYANKVIETDLRNPSAWYIKGVVSKDNVEYSTECWKKAISYSPDNSPIKMMAVDALSKPAVHLFKGTKKMKFVREDQWFAINPAAKVFLDNKQVMTVKNGETQVVDIGDGEHTLTVKFVGQKTVVPLNVDKDVIVNMRIDRATGMVVITHS